MAAARAPVQSPLVITTNPLYFTHLSHAMHPDIVMRTQGLHALVQLLKHMDRRTTPDVLLYQLAFASVHESAGMHLLSVLFRRWAPTSSASRMTQWFQTELSTRNDIIIAYAVSAVPAERRWFWKLAEVVWPFDSSSGLLTCCVLRSPMDAIGLLSAYIVSDTATARPQSLVKRLHSAAKLARCLIRTASPAAALDTPARLQNICSLLLQHHRPLLCKEHVASTFAVVVHATMRTTVVLPESWAALIWALLHSESTHVLALLMIEELADRGGTFMLPLIQYGLVNVLIDHIEHIDSPSGSIAAMFALSQLAAYEFVWIQLMQADMLRRLHTIIQSSSVCETIRLELRGLLQEAVRYPAPFIHMRFKECGLGSLLPSFSNRRRRGAAAKSMLHNEDKHESTEESDDDAMSTASSSDVRHDDMPTVIA